MANSELQNLGLAVQYGAMSDPGSGGTVPMVADTMFSLLKVAGSGTRTLANGAFEGQCILVVNNGAATATINDVNATLSLSLAAREARFLVYVGASRWFAT